MRIAYLVRYDVGASGGIQRKLAAQLRLWSQRGHQVRLFAHSLSGPPSAVFDGIDVEVETLIPGAGAPLGFARLVRRVRRWRPDLAYVRFSTYKVALELLWHRVPVVLEVNDLYRTDIFFRWWQRPAHRATLGRAMRAARGVVAVTDEISRRASTLGARTTTISNGIELDRVEALPVAPAGGAAQLVFLAQGDAIWHGVDEIVALARAMPEAVIHLVGPTVAGGAPSNLRVHGFLPPDAYRHVLQDCDVALGTAALFRKGMREACTLKVREYLALGLPVVLPHTDADFPTGAPFLLDIPCRAGALAEHADDIRAFAKAWRGRRVPRAELAHLDAGTKEAQRLAFFAQTLRVR